MDTRRINELFSASYAEARQKFLHAATARGLAVDSYELPLAGAQGETLATDVVLDGPEGVSKLLVVLSGVHGVEGFCGSAVQSGMLRLEGALRPRELEDAATLYVHAVNPYGFSHLRRVTQENVDPNRNFIDFAQPLPVNPGYAEIHDLLLPPEWPPRPEVSAALDAYREQHGARGMQRAIGLGQYAFADGMFFGGLEPTWSNRTFRRILRRYASEARQIGAIDIHTGLGPYGVGERIFASNDNGVLERAARWWGPLTSVHTGSSTSIPMTGPIQYGLFEECPDAEHVGICLEFGTWPNERVMAALRAEHWLHRRGSDDAAQAAAIKRDLKDAFYPEADDWKRMIWEQGSQACLQALRGLQDAGRTTTAVAA